MSRLFEALQISERGGVSDVQTALGAAALLDAAERDGARELGDVHTIHIAPLPDSRLISITDKESLGAEKFRFLAVRLRQMQQTKNLKRILITSSIAEEGKSLVSANLAVTLARKKKQKVLLIEGDLRRPVLAQEFGLGRLSGLSEALKSDSPVLKSIYYLEEAGLWFLPAGVPPDNALELMQSGRLPDFLEHASNFFDWIVIDSPPILPLADTTVWSRMSDGIVLVARQGKTEKRALQRGVEALAKANVLGVVLNSCLNVDRTNYYQRYGPVARAAHASSSAKS
ncbi:MAG TPA: CpsD/CapB family tyrosine-protein kinase [Terriglobales bacterium]|jgi:capsular exopolysaccharide synthesis family protein